ncbi:MAG: MHS family MFS transporter [Pseudomonadota bacterium]|nr:MHS family MFS transporter [Pseudomonadota bacterium]
MPSQAADSLSTGSAREARRAVIAATVGTMIEWYDFYVYGLVAALVFGKLYFPQENVFAGTLLALSTFFLGFVARPIGAALFGHYGDRIGRKATLIATLMLMGVSTILVGLVPTYASIGIWGGIVLVVLRVLQGIGVGGEWGGSVAVATEWSQFNKRRGLVGSWPQFGSPLGLLLALLVLNIVNRLGSAEWFNTVGWRIPFLLSVVLIGIGLYIRVGVLETPVFTHIREKRQVHKAPVLDVIKYHWREIALTCLIRTGQQAPFYLFTTFLVSYGSGTLHLSQSFLFDAVLVTSCVSLVTTPLFGYVSDRIGRKRMYIIGALVMMAFAFPYYALLDTRVEALVFLAILLSLPVHDMQYGPQAAFIAESFPPSMRYSGSSLGYQLASVTSGGPAPLIAAWLIHTYHSSIAISIYLAVLAGISVLAAFFLRDRSGFSYDTEEGWDADEGSALALPAIGGEPPR